MFLLISTLLLAIGAFSVPAAEDVPADMVLIPAGEFQMGSYHGDADEKPVHSVYLDAFYMDKYEVTVGEYKRFVESTGHRTLPEWVAQCSPTAPAPCRRRELARCNGVCEMGWHAVTNGRGVGKSRPGRPNRAEISMGQYA